MVFNVEKTKKTFQNREKNNKKMKKTIDIILKFGILRNVFKMQMRKIFIK
ncbi:protein of unknown function [Tepidibacter aestuarii]|nr:protein of unknown function [Tepidibacter aestuarii]